MSIPNIEHCNLHSKTVLLRVDFNVPIEHDKICDITRILRVLPTIQYLKHQNTKIILLSHFGRPTMRNNNLSLRKIVDTVSSIFNRDVQFIDDCIGHKVLLKIQKMKNGDIILLENVRFYQEEESNSSDFARELSDLADIYINDAFSCSHRTHASIVGITRFLPSYGGFCLQNEIKFLQQAISYQDKPVTAIIGGSKILNKIKILKTLAQKVDYLILGGAIANNFLLFNKINIGKSFFQDGIDSILEECIVTSHNNNCRILLPEDILVARNSNYNVSILRNIQDVLDDDTILDVGIKTVHSIKTILRKSKMLIWNGPMGMFEHSAFANGTIALMKEISRLTYVGKLSSIIGGGDSISAMHSTMLTDKDFTYVSTGGGAFLNWFSNNEMPGIIALKNNPNNYATDIKK
ncbi:phosphoglycerate kinase [Wolbachia endosymbiont of Howardula sp.]|uniref:phosphoglycerate kinase n=1 Tax=Wolbachia endosymbiont of Howardula sp. TaxID=2916816 RepID=UPI00217DF73C|nr:phosphoglycerate kinase [Wolbachia endosymbiont of Howardula sp.]UWI83360.1 phosphoglycerate kinase [Wolbachia endosymbiont of Howardula sp.]